MVLTHEQLSCVIYEVCPEGVQSCNMKNRDIHWRRYKIQETLHIRQWCLSRLQSRHLGTSQFSQSPSSALSYFPESHWWSEISFLSKVISFGEARSLRAPNLGCRGAESPGWFDASQKNYMRCDAWVGVLSCCNCQSQVARSCGRLHYIASLNWWRTLK